MLKQEVQTLMQKDNPLHPGAYLHDEDAGGRPNSILNILELVGE